MIHFMFRRLTSETRRKPPCDQVRWQLLKERQNVATLQLAADDHFASGVNSVNLEHRLGDVETDCCDRLHGYTTENKLTSIRYVRQRARAEVV